MNSPNSNREDPYVTHRKKSSILPRANSMGELENDVEQNYTAECPLSQNEKENMYGQLSAGKMHDQLPEGNLSDQLPAGKMNVQSSESKMHDQLLEGKMHDQRSEGNISDQLPEGSKPDQLPTGNMTIPVAMFQQFVNSVNTQFGQLRQELQTLKTMQTQIDEVDQIATEALDTAQTNTDDIETLNNNVQTLEKDLQQAYLEIEETKLELTKMDRELKTVKDANSLLENYVRRDNLIFMNVPSTVNENCEKVVRNILKNMNIEDCESVRLLKCYRMKIGKVPYPILCGFYSFEDRQRVYEKKANLKGTQTFIQEHFSDSMFKQRRALLPIQQAAKKMGLRAFLKLDKVVIEGKTYGSDNLGDLPQSLQYVVNGCKQSKEAVVFYGERSPLSNFYKTSFTENGITYQSTEMYLQHQKAILFKDEVTASKILASKSPAQAKALSYQIKHVDEAVWETKAPGIMKKGLEHKFNTDSHCKMTLLETGSCIMGEATSSDKFWGTGVALFDSLALNHGAWTGQNHMGRLLQEIREQLSF